MYHCRWNCVLCKIERPACWAFFQLDNVSQGSVQQATVDFTGVLLCCLWLCAQAQTVARFPVFASQGSIVMYTKPLLDVPVSCKETWQGIVLEPATL